MTGSLELLWDNHCELTDRHVNLVERVDRVSESAGLVKPGKPHPADKVPDPPAATKPAPTRPPQPPPPPRHAPSPPAPTNEWGKNQWHEDRSGWTEGMKQDAQKLEQGWKLGADGEWYKEKDDQSGWIMKDDQSGSTEAQKAIKKKVLDKCFAMVFLRQSNQKIFGSLLKIFR